MSIVIRRLQKSFGAQQVLKSVSETFADAQISVLLGASGCGKTTTLRCIAGLERPSGGEIVVAGRTVYQDSPALWIAPERRQMAMVFQSYAIWPHMTVFENVRLPLRAAGIGGAKARNAVMATLQLVGLDAFASRSATQLSGGQQQRVALARAIVSEAPVILMDEPLSNLDAKLRVEMRIEIRALQRRLGRTILFVTHDQEEAMSIADTVYLYHNGTVIQKGAPKDLYDHPASRHAAEFLGRANIIANYEWQMAANGPVFALPGGLALPAAATTQPPQPGELLCIRPEKWRVRQAGTPGAIAGRVAEASFVGNRTEYRIDTAFGQMSVVQLDAGPRLPGDAVSLEVNPTDIRVIGA
ncbi:ABC transporter ATP-binding protein [Paraburkholderia fungorum]|uniref:ABC transporter ATP-binding protein n=1 Tax=Paraburkholderia fungorum TaxID=134537 RepID=UPI0038BCF85A